MGMLEHNLAAFAERYPQHVAQMRSAVADGAAVLPAVAPTIDTAMLATARQLLILGVGDGKAIPDFFRQLPAARRPHCVLVEHSWAHLAAAFATADWAPLLHHPRAHCVIGLEGQALRNALNVHCDLNTSKDAYCIAAFDPDRTIYYEHVQQHYAQVGQARLRDAFTLPDDTYFGLFNLVENWARHAQTPMFEALAGVYRDRPGIIIASGPSLAGSLPLVREYQERAVLCCVNNAVPVMQQHGITPHFVGLTERTNVQTRHFADMQPFDGTWLVTQPYVASDTLAAWQGPVCYMLRDLAYVSWFFPEARRHCFGGSVVHFMFRALQVLGCSPIILVGQDLAFPRDHGQPYVAGVTSATVHKRIGQQGDVHNVEVPGNDGRPITTPPDYARFITQYEQLIDETGMPVINAIPEHLGARIRGATRMDPAAALAQYCTQPVDRTRIARTLMPPPADGAGSGRAVLQARAVALQQYVEDDLAPQLLALMHQISLFYMRQQANMYLEEFDTHYSQLLAALEQQLNALRTAQPELHDVVYTFTQHSQITMTLRVSELHADPRPMREKAHLYVEAIQQHLHTTLAWCQRIAMLMRVAANA